jgi:reverse transcriptase-like protein
VLRTATTGPVRLVRVRQPGGVRTIAVLEANTRDRYVRLVARAADRLEEALSPNVVANRVAFRSIDPPELRLRPWRLERRVFTARLAEVAQRFRKLAFADVLRCYASISPAMAADALRRLQIDAADELETFLAALQLAGVRGLPVGPAASAVLANAVLAPVDRSLEAAGIAHLRWVDDVVLATRDPDRALRALSRAVAEIGLRLNDRKTRVVVDPTKPAGALVSRR